MSSEYQFHYSSGAFWSKVGSSSSAMGCVLIEKALTLYYLLTKGDVSVATKVLIIGALGYLISPIDVIPDVIPIIGYSDDLAVISALLLSLDSRVTPKIKKQVQRSMPAFCQ